MIIARLAKRIQHESNPSATLDRQAHFPLHYQGYTFNRTTGRLCQSQKAPHLSQINKKKPIQQATSLPGQHRFDIRNRTGAADTTKLKWANERSLFALLFSLQALRNNNTSHFLFFQSATTSASQAAPALLFLFCCHKVKSRDCTKQAGLLFNCCHWEPELSKSNSAVTTVLN